MVAQWRGIQGLCVLVVCGLLWSCGENASSPEEQDKEEGPSQEELLEFAEPYYEQDCREVVCKNPGERFDSTFMGSSVISCSWDCIEYMGEKRYLGLQWQDTMVEDVCRDPPRVTIVTPEQVFVECDE